MHRRRARHLRFGDAGKVLRMVLAGDLAKCERWIARVRRTDAKRALALNLAFLGMLEDLRTEEVDAPRVQ